MQMTSEPPSQNSALPIIPLLPPLEPSEELALDIARQLLSHDELFEKYETDILGVQALIKNPGFAAVVAQHRKDWLDSTSTDERVRIKAKMAEENLLIDMHHIVKNPVSANGDRIAAFKALQASAGLPKNPAAGSAALGPATGGVGGIHVTVNLDGAKHEMDFDLVIPDDLEPLEHDDS